jgi:hypothetical protein
MATIGPGLRPLLSGIYAKRRSARQTNPAFGAKIVLGKHDFEVCRAL